MFDNTYVIHSQIKVVLWRFLEVFVPLTNDNRQCNIQDDLNPEVHSRDNLKTPKGLVLWSNTWLDASQDFHSTWSTMFSAVNWKDISFESHSNSNDQFPALLKLWYSIRSLPQSARKVRSQYSFFHPTDYRWDLNLGFWQKRYFVRLKTVHFYP